MLKFFGFLIVAPLLLAPGSAEARVVCNDPACKAWERGVGSRVGPPATCLVQIVASTFGGKVALDVRKDDRTSRWGAPRVKHVGTGTVTYYVGCEWVLGKTTAEVYLCAEGPDGTFTSIRWRKEGDLDTLPHHRDRKRRTVYRLDMCLKGEECPRYLFGEPPR